MIQKKTAANAPQAAPPIDDKTRAILRENLSAIEHHLFNGIVPFWFTRALDREYGGFLTNFDSDGRTLPTPEKYVNTQCRLIWWFSTLNRRFPDMDQAAEFARRGVDFLIRHFWDEKVGGFFWKVNRDGSELDSAKIVYGESFCIYALSEYYRATQDKRGLDYASQTFDLLQKYCADTQNGGYLENVDRSWNPEPGGFPGGDRKGLDTHMHLMESFTTLYLASADELHRRKLVELIHLICDRMIDKKTGCGLNQFDLQFQSLPAISIQRTWNGERLGEQPPNPIDTTSYGHNVELAFLMRLALTSAGSDLSPFLPILKRLLDHAVEHGIDWEQGGIFRDGDRSTGKPLILEKEFWQHTEALTAFLDGYEQFHQPEYLQAFDNLWRFVHKHMIDQTVGEWRTLLDRSGSPIDPNIGNPWKVSYHSGRAMLESRALLMRLTGA